MLFIYYLTFFNNNGVQLSDFRTPEGHLEEKVIKISRFRSDSAACTKEVLAYLDTKPDIEYFIKFHKHRNSFTKVSMVRNWVEIPKYNVNVGDIQYSLYGKRRRMVVIRNLDDDDPSSYSGIVTNNNSLSNKEVFCFYALRGAIERNFDDLKNNFNWGRLPFSFLNENTVFLLISAIAYCIYQFIIDLFSKKVDFVKKTFRLKNFIFHFITVGSEWEEEQTLRLFTDKEYNLLI